MADKNKKQELPNTPQYTADPQFRQALADLTGAGTRLSNLDFSGGWNPLLAETTQFNPATLQTLIDTLKQKLTPAFNESNTALRNELANIGALESSTASNAFAKNYGDFQNTLQVQAGEFGLAQTMKALENRISLEGLGLNTLNSAVGIGQRNEENRNNFNLVNYNNEVGRQLYDEQNQSGGWLGALKGGIGGGLVGAGLSVAAAPFTGGASLAYIPAALGAGVLGGAALGGFGNNATGNLALQGGLTMAPSMMMSRYGTTGHTPNSSASNDPFGRNGNVNARRDLLTQYLYGGLQ